MARGAKTKKVKTLTEELAALLDKALLPDLKERAKQPRIAASLRKQHDAEKARHRTASSFEEWVEHTVEQVGAAWILSCVFVRTLEDRGLVDRRRLAGPGALDSQQQFFEIAPSLTERDYVLTVFREFAAFPGAVDVLGPAHNPSWRLSPSNDSVRALLALLREEDGGALRFGFGGTDTHFLGNLYQDLSEGVRERYALLQTPNFVERFILDQTLEPAITEFGLETVRIIDPTCGSGHFLLGAFHRLCDHRMRVQPGVDRRDHATRALAQVYGVDLNPYAIAIARFRLMLAYLEEAGIDKLTRAPRIETNLVVADSLLHGGSQRRLGEAVEEAHKAAWGDEMFVFENAPAARRIFGQRYHAVVGNPPYITCKDAALRERYRERYESASGQFALAAPFTERFIELTEDTGFFGLINTNSFTKREFGKTLIERVLPRIDLFEVVDTSGAYIPGHSTPTVLLFGRKRTAVANTVRAVMGKHGEPSTPSDPEKGAVWSSIKAHHEDVDFENEYISVAEVPRETFNLHPWSLVGGGVADVKQLLQNRAATILGDMVQKPIGRAARTGADEVFAINPSAIRRHRIPQEFRRGFLTGEQIRDWSVSDGDVCVFPYRADTLTVADLSSEAHKYLWPYRTILEARGTFQGVIADAGLRWYEYMQYTKSAHESKLSIAFAFVATHNHFILDHGGKVFKQSAPVIKLPSQATEDDHLALLAYLNTSTACFWMKQFFYPKATSTSDISTEKGVPENNRYEFTGTGLQKLPVPTLNPCLISLARELDALGARKQSLEPEPVLRQALARNSNVAEALQLAEGEQEMLLHRMVALQEDLDWMIYSLFGLASSACAKLWTPAVSLRPEERPFASDEPPARLTISDAELWHARKAATAASSELQMIESPMFKRRWRGARGVFATKVATYSERSSNAVRLLLGEWLEAAFRDETKPMTVRALVSRLPRELEQLLSLLGGGDVVSLLAEIAAENSIPFISPLVYAGTGITKHAEWENIWALQRREDIGVVTAKDIPPRYEPKDYLDFVYWRLRGKLDVPTERFISYSGCERDDDKSPLIGWAGWNHLERAQTLAALFQERKEQDGWERERLTPILAGLLELVPWLKQWHNEPDPAYGGERMGDAYEGFVSEKAREFGLTLEQLRDWRPDPKKGARGAKARRKDSEAADDEEEDGAIQDHEAPDEDAVPAPKRRRGRSKKATA